MNKLNIFCFGFGQVAKNFVLKIKSENISFNLNTTSREQSKKKIFENIYYQNFYFDKNEFDKDLINKLDEADHILISIPPINNKDIVIENFEKNFNSKKLKWITYLSATSVYGNHQGKWVNEKSITNPTSANGILRLNTEKNWLKLSRNFDLPLQIFRLSGIYSNQHNILKKLRLGEVKIVNKKDHFFSRIHVEDIANVLHKSLKNIKKGEIFNISDDKPAPSKELIMHGVKLLGINKPQTIEVEDIESEMLKNFYKDSKKVSNKKMKNFFKFNLKFPTYIEGLNHINNNFI